MGVLKEIYDKTEFNSEMKSTLVGGVDIIDYTESVLKENGIPEESIIRENDQLTVKDVNKDELLNLYLKGVRYAPLDIKKIEDTFIIKKR